MLLRWRWLSWALAIASSTACAGEPDHHQETPNVLLITIDTLRADHLSTYGYEARSTPHIDALGEAGVVFEAAHCDVPWTFPSMASSLTGTYSLRHGIKSSGHRLPERSITLAQRLGAIGYRTRAVIGSFALSSQYGLDRGFETYDDDFTWVADGAPWTTARRTDEEVTEVAAGHLRNLKAIPPFFLWVHYMGPHSIFRANERPGRVLGRHAARYPDKVVATDAAVGDLLDVLEELGLEDDTLVILHSDHGESLGDRKFIGHGRYLYENVLRVPLILRWPARLPRGVRVRHLVGNVDIVPTVLEAVGHAAPEEEFDGRSLFPAIFEDVPVREELYIETLLPAHKMFAEPIVRSDGSRARVGVRRTGVLRPPLKYIRTELHPLFSGDSPDLSEEERARLDREELYRIPREREGDDLAGEREAERLDLSTALSDYFEDAAPAGPVRPPTPSDQERLRALGYVE